MDLILGEENDKRNRKGKKKTKQGKNNNNKAAARRGKKQQDGTLRQEGNGAKLRQDQAKKSKDVHVRKFLSSALSAFLTRMLPLQRYMTALVRSYLLDRVEAALVCSPRHFF